MKHHSGIATEPDAHFMRLALNEATDALDEGEVPVGAVVVRGERVIGRGHNQRERLNDPTAHAEMIALTASAASVGSWRLEGCTLYVTLEPCVMCAGAMVLARLQRVVFGAIDPKAGACGSLYRIPSDVRLNHRVDIASGVLSTECGRILTDFFARRRASARNEQPGT